MSDALLFGLVDAAGNGVCRLGPDGTIVAMSERFQLLTGLTDAARGRRLESLLPGLEDRTVALRRVGRDGIARELEPVAHTRGTDAFLLVVDHSRLARAQRQEARLGREVADLRAELEVRERAPARGLVRDARSFANRLHEAVERAKRYGHPLAVLMLQLEVDADSAAVAEAILAGIRGVDEVGEARPSCWIVLLPHTDLGGAKIAAERIRSKVIGAGGRRVSIGAAQWRSGEVPRAFVTRAEEACKQAFARDGGVLLAVDVV